MVWRPSFLMFSGDTQLYAQHGFETYTQTQSLLDKESRGLQADRTACTVQSGSAAWQFVCHTNAGSDTPHSSLTNESHFCPTYATTSDMHGHVGDKCPACIPKHLFPFERQNQCCCSY